MNTIPDMSAHLVLPQAYCSAEYHDYELKSIFPHTWLFAGLMLELEGKTHRGLRLGNTTAGFLTVRAFPPAFRKRTPSRRW